MIISPAVKYEIAFGGSFIMFSALKRSIIKSNVPKVSVILPVYNEEPFLRQCLDSIINQTLKDIEIICVDDGSTDNSLSILREYEEKDQRSLPDGAGASDGH